MPIFSSSSDLHIDGGNFYDIAGDMNVQTNAYLAVQDDDSQTALGPGAHRQNHQLLGGDRRGRLTGAARTLAYSHVPLALKLQLGRNQMSSKIDSDVPSATQSGISGSGCKASVEMVDSWLTRGTVNQQLDGYGNSPKERDMADERLRREGEGGVVGRVVVVESKEVESQSHSSSDLYLLRQHDVTLLHILPFALLALSSDSSPLYYARNTTAQFEYHTRLRFRA
ncbi:hypothetical protein B0H14DRAFT_3168624 [Mycena olivaceomarginata]|nr:hypothetical protein B0H14DRAFT_3168624 [Mycena olivaceomarginata]